MRPEAVEMFRGSLHQEADMLRRSWCGPDIRDMSGLAHVLQRSIETDARGRKGTTSFRFGPHMEVSELISFSRGVFQLHASL